MNNPESPRLQKQASVYEILLLAGIVTALTIGTAAAYPIWDDRRMLFLIDQNGIQAIQWSFGIRPLPALLFTFLFNHRLMLPISLVFHWLGWFGMALVTMRLWRLMFPSHAKLALLPALLSVAPVLCKVQLVVFTVVFIAIFPTLLAFVGLFFLLSDEPARTRKIIFNVVGLILAALATMISEYGALAAAVGVPLLISKAIRIGKARKREPLMVAGLLALSLVSFYVFFLKIGSGSNPGFLPSYSLQYFSWKIAVIPFRLLSGLWRGAMGGVLEALALVTLNSKMALLSFVSGATLSILVFLVIDRKHYVAAELRANAASIVSLVVTTIVVLTPVLLMDRTLESRWDSRFYLPLLPILSSLTVFTLLSLVRKRLWLLVAILCGFLAGYWTAAEITATIRNRDSVRNEDRGRAPRVFPSITAPATTAPVDHL